MLKHKCHNCNKPCSNENIVYDTSLGLESKEFCNECFTEIEQLYTKLNQIINLEHWSLANLDAKRRKQKQP